MEDALDVAHRLAVHAVRRRIADGEVSPNEGLLEELTEVELELHERLGRRYPAPGARKTRATTPGTA
jgi:hypothetical protein